MTKTCLLFLTCAAILPMSALGAPLVVTSSADSGEGTLRAALDQAATAEDAATVVIATDSDIGIAASLTYDGTAPLTILGASRTIRADGNFHILHATQGADLHLVDLTLRGPGGFSIEARGDADGVAGKGVFVDLRDDQDGTVSVEFDRVTVADVAGHGVHVSDCSLSDACGAGGGGAGDGSPASISIRAAELKIENVGQGRFDADGLRVDERGAGDIRFTATDSVFTGVGADGVELDEGQAGDVIVRVTGGAFDANGDYCDPARLAAFMPAEPEGEFAEGTMAQDAIPAAISGSPDDTCFEREVDLYDDGSVEAYEFAIDTDDGFDIDEAGEGSIQAVFYGSSISGNFDEGLDFDEEDAGDIALTLVATTATGNTDDGYKNSEEGDGSVTGVILGAVAGDNGGVGFVFEEADGGDTHVTATGIATAGNDDGETGLEVVQEDAGRGSLTIIGGEIADGQKVEGVDLM